jgi:NAD(P)H-hydrate repair Nnr-like enzyme with NAD(P)H-hydrate epimerase domain
MRPASLHLVAAARAYADAKVPTSELMHNLAAAVAQELADSLGGRVDVLLPVGMMITRWPKAARSA